MKKFLSAGGLVFACHLMMTKVAYAGWENNPIAQQNAHIQNIFSDCLRWMVWEVIKLCYRCSQFFEKALDNVFKITPSFVSSEGFNHLMNMMFKLGWSFVTVILIYIGIKQFTKSGLGLCKQAFINLFVIVSVLASLTTPIYGKKTLIPLLADLSQNAIHMISGNTGGLGLSKQLILENLVDVKHAYDTEKQHNLKYTTFNPDYLDYNELIASKDIGGKFPVYDQQTGQWTTKPIATGLWGWFDTNVYRWNVRDPFILILQFIVITLGFIFASLKFLRLILELGFKQLLLPFVGLTDIETGQRFKRLLSSIGTTCLLMVIVVLLFRVYQLGNNWISNSFGLTVTDGTMGYLRFLGYLANTLLLLDGPKIVEELFGMDVGVSGEAVRTGSHMMNIGRHAVGGVKATMNGVSSAKEFVTSGKRGEWVKRQTQNGKAGVQWAGQKVKNGASEMAHFKGFDENGKVMSSHPKHQQNDSRQAQHRQSLAEMGQNAWSGTQAMAERMKTKGQDMGFDAKTRLQESERVKKGMKQAQTFGQKAKDVGQQVVNSHLDQFQPQAQQLKAMNVNQQEKLAKEKQNLTNKKQSREYDLSQETPAPKPREEMTRSEKFDAKWSQVPKEVSTESTSPVPQSESSQRTWQEDLQHQLIESGNGHLVKAHMKQQQKQQLKDRLQQVNRESTPQQRLERVKQTRSKADRRAYRQQKQEEREW